MTLKGDLLEHHCIMHRVSGKKRIANQLEPRYSRKTGMHMISLSKWSSLIDFKFCSWHLLYCLHSFVSWRTLMAMSSQESWISYYQLPTPWKYLWYVWLFAVSLICEAFVGDFWLATLILGSLPWADPSLTCPNSHLSLFWDSPNLEQ